MLRSTSLLIVATAFLGFATPLPAADDVQFTAEQVRFFDEEVRPLLQARCFKCHGPEGKPKAGFRLTSRDAIVKGGDLGPAVKLDKPAESLLIQAINYGELKMPPDAQLPAKDVAILTRWVNEKLPYGKPFDVQPTTEEHAKPADGVARVYRLVVRPAPPAVKDAKWVANPIDAFILAPLEKKGLAPAKPAAPAELLRRLTFDLTGLPPTPEQVDRFLADPSLAAYEKLVDELLASQQYGEKWGRHWLDLVRYAETHGYERDNPKPFAWRYRDYVINAFRDDKPYDQFLTEQLAGDELNPQTTEGLIATGYYRLGIWDDEPADRPLAKYDVLDGVVSTTSQVMLGMTLNCARCHDHKKDPLLARDYYSLLAFFHDVTDMNGASLRRITNEAERAEFAARLAERHGREAQLHAEKFRIEQEFKLALAEKTGEAVDALPVSDMVDLTYRFYRDSWNKLPDFEPLKAETTGSVAHNFFSLDPASRAEAIGLVFEGRLKVPEAGEYTFDIEATAGARLLIDGKKIIDVPNKGTHARTETADLKAGLLPIRLEYFNAEQKPRLKLTWAGPGVPRRALTDDAPGVGEQVLRADSRKEAQAWRYTTMRPSDDWMQPEFDGEKWKTGPGGFGTQGTPGAVVRTAWNTNDIWLRTTFNVARPPAGLTLVAHNDEDFEVYLNGQKIYAAAGFVTDYRRIPLGPDALKALKTGENLLAVHCKQTGGGQYIDVGLVDARDKWNVPDLLRQKGRDVIGAEQADRYAALTKELDALRKEKPPEPGFDVMCVEERGSNPTHILLRGNPALVGDVVPPAFPEVLGFKVPTLPSTPTAAGTSGKRLVLANWITSKENPLTARVLVNRLWQYHFGRGIIPSSNDFGLLGETATHPDLLDWLAAEFMAGDWRIRRMQKLIVMSQAYRMSIRGSAQDLADDPGNQLFGRFNPRRLTAEELRDTILWTTGVLNPRPAGPSIYPAIPAAVLAGQSRPGSGWGNSPPEEASRRSVYIHVKRSLLVPILSDHDAADTDSSCAVRYTTTVPTQALGMLNSEFLNEQAALFARRLEKSKPGQLADQVQLGLRLTTGGVPSKQEVADDVAFVQQLEQRGLPPARALQEYCLVLLNTNAFCYVD